MRKGICKCACCASECCFLFDIQTLLTHGGHVVVAVVVADVMIVVALRHVSGIRPFGLNQCIQTWDGRVCTWVLMRGRKLSDKKLEGVIGYVRV